MITHGQVCGGVVVLDAGEQLPEGARVTVIPEQEAPDSQPPTDTMTPVQHARILQILDEIAALPIEGMTDPFSGADHDRALYGAP